MEIIGVNRKTGDYEGRPYDNVNFHGKEPFEDGEGVGEKVKSYKVRYSVLTEIFGKELTDKELSAFIGQDAEFYFDEFRNVKYIAVHK